MSIVQRNRIEVPLHLVWTTKDRRALLVGEVERVCYRCIGAEAAKAGCTVLALNGLTDHVHLLVMFPTTVSIAKLMQHVKGVSSALLRDTFPDCVFQWAEGYGVFAVSRGDLPRVIAYIENQKQRHQERLLEPDWEEPRLTLEIASGGRSAEGP